jgi:ADP-ribosylglycohydrolase
MRRLKFRERASTAKERMENIVVTRSERAHGCLLGQAIGDALGAPVEGYSPASIRKHYGYIADFLQDRPVGTDDTEYAVLNALILLEYGLDLDEDDLLDAWRRWLMAPDSGFKGGGFSDVIAMHNLRRGLRPPASGRFNQHGASDGLAMAVGPVGVACAGDPERAAAVAALLGSATNGRDGIHAGQAVAAGVAVAMSGAQPPAILDAALAVLPRDCWTYRALARAAQIVAAQHEPEAAHAALHENIAVSFFPWADIAPEATALAFGAFLIAGGRYREAVTGAVNQGRDADTIGAIAGALAGAYGGIEAIPAQWRARIGPVPGRNFSIVAGIALPELADRLIARFLPADREAS